MTGVFAVIGMYPVGYYVARARSREFASLAETGAHLVGLDAATALMSEHEYREVEPETTRVTGIEEFLSEEIAAGRIAAATPTRAKASYRLFGHCTEAALRSQTMHQWTEVLNHFRISATPVRTGCYGMAGLFGHEKRNVSLSRKLFQMSWREPIEVAPKAALATGYSCRFQAKRFTGHRPRHPVEILHAALPQRAIG